MARCEVCGRPYDGEALLPREIACQGCHAEYAAFALKVDDKGRFKFTDELALALARGLHTARERVALKAEVLRRYEANAAGKHAVTGAPLEVTGVELAGAKAQAAEIVARLKRRTA